MKKLAIALGLVLVCSLSAYADPEVHTVPTVVETGFTRYVVNPAQFVHRFTWGVLSVAYRIGKAPVDAGFKLVGQTIGTEPNIPLWE
jgi:hypothetical protein